MKFEVTNKIIFPLSCITNSESKFTQKKAKQKLVGSETEVRGFAESDLNLWSESPSTTAMGLETEGQVMNNMHPWPITILLMVYGKNIPEFINKVQGGNKVGDLQCTFHYYTVEWFHQAESMASRYIPFSRVDICFSLSLELNMSDKWLSQLLILTKGVSSDNLSRQWSKNILTGQVEGNDSQLLVLEGSIVWCRTSQLHYPRKVSFHSSQYHFVILLQFFCLTERNSL